MAVGAQAEHRRIKLRMMGARSRLRDQGYLAEGAPPYGYRRKRSSGTARTPEERREVYDLVIHEEEAKVVRAIFRACVAGHSTLRLAADMGVGRSFVHAALRRRFYTGQIKTFDGSWIKGKHPAIIDAATFAKAQTALKARALGGPRTRGEETTQSWWLRDIACCALCGRRMMSSWSHTKHHPDRREYYACAGRTRDHRCTAPYIRVRDAEDRASVFVMTRLVQLRRELAAPPEEPAPRPRSTAEKRAAFVQRRERYVDAFASGLMTKDSLAAKVAQIDAHLLKLDADEPTPSPLADDKKRKALLTTVTGIAKAWEKASPQRRREIVNLLAVSVKLAAAKGGVASPGFAWRTADDLAIADVASRLL